MKMLTLTGEYLDFNNVEAYSFDIACIGKALSRICRFGGHTSSFYSVAQHSVLVAQNVSKEHKLQALLHDAAEAFVGDMIYPLKVHAKDYCVLEKEVTSAIFKQFNLSKEMPAEVKNADLRALATEKRDFFDDNEEWPILKGITPFEIKIKPLSIDDACKQFLDMYFNE